MAGQGNVGVRMSEIVGRVRESAGEVEQGDVMEAVWLAEVEGAVVVGGEGGRRVVRRVVRGGV